MKKIFFLLIILIALPALSMATYHEPAKQKAETTVPVKVIWDSDMQWDWDDVGALAILNAMADLGEVEIIAIGSSTRGDAGKWNPHTFDIINTYYHRPDIPIGKSLSGPALEDVYGQWAVNQGFPHELAPGQVWDDVIKLYRKILSEQPDTSVVIVTTGYTSNIRDLLLSQPDEYSNLNGKDLVEQKIKFWSCMGGRYPGTGGEANFQDWSGHTKYAVDNFPRPVIGTSSETGNASAAGSALEFTPETNPVRAIYRKRLDDQGYPNTFSHNTWDLIATLVAVRNPHDYFNLTASGTNVITIQPDGEQTNKWEPEPDHGYRYLIQTNSSYVSSVLDELIGRLPLPVPTSELKISVYGTGAVDPMGGNYDTGTMVTLTAFPGICHKFNNWQGGLSGSENPATIKMTEDKTIAAIFSKIDGCKVPDLLMRWPLNQTLGPEAIDSSGNQFNIELVNTDNTWHYDNDKGWILKLNGIDEYGQVSSLATSELQTASFSITLFVKIKMNTLHEWKRVAGIGNAYGFNIDKNGKLGFWNHFGNDKWHGSYANNSNLADGNWHHIAITHSDTDGNILFVDGAPVLTQNWTDGTGNSIVFPGGDLFKLGTNEGSNNLPAGLQDMRIYNRVLSRDEINSVMNGNDLSGIINNSYTNPFSISNYPNPFTFGTTIGYTLPKKGLVNIVIYDEAGRVVTQLINKVQTAGKHTIYFNTSMMQKSGIYYCVLKSENIHEVRKMVLQL